MPDDSLFLSAGEPSGDNASARLVHELLQSNSDLTIFGLGGKRLKKLGQIQFAEPADLAVIGFWEVAKKYFYFRKLFYKCIKEIEERKPKVIILVDYPGFNLRLAKKIKHLGIPIIYYISPQIWAWGKKRIKDIQQYVDLMIPILPFEKKFYQDSNINVEFVGNYLLEDIDSDFIASSIPSDGHLALLPGSRLQEIERMLPSIIETAKLIYQKYKIKSVIAGVEGIFPYEKLLTESNKEYISIRYNSARQVIYESQLVLTASGTATLETGIIGRPMVVVYKTGFLTFQIARHLVELDKIALINLVLDKKVVPELIQHDATVRKMFAALEQYILDKKYCADVVKQLNSVVEILGEQNPSKKAANLIGEYLA